MKETLLGKTKEELEKIVTEFSAPKFRAGQILGFLASGKEISEMKNLGEDLISKLNEKFCSFPISIEKVLEGRDGTKKYLFKFLDGNIIEGVFMPHSYGNTVCVSTQIGCRMGCEFCASGLSGLIRNMTAEEILAEVLLMNKEAGGSLKDRKITNVVLMGSGEPLDNYDNVSKFLTLIMGKDYLNIGQRNISLSTSGLVPKIKQLADDFGQLTLSLSLHAPNDEIRKKLMKVANAYSIEEVLDAVKYYFEKTKRRVIIEYIMIDGVNNSPENAKELYERTKSFSCHINLINMNPVKEKNLRGLSPQKQKAFLDELLRLGASATIRHSMGNDIEGACGQLRRRYTSEG